jgi:hypothetical protein
MKIIKILRKLYKKCYIHKGEWKQYGIAYNMYGETEHTRTCIKCGKIQNKIF